MQMVKWFLEQGLAAERTRPADTNGVEVTCCRRNSELGEFLSWVLSLQGEHTRAPWHPVFFPYVPLIFSPLPLSTVTYFWFTGRHPHCPQTRGWTLDRSQARGESWSLPSAVYRGEFFSVLSFSLPFLHFFFSFWMWVVAFFTVIKVDTCRLALWSDGVARVMNWTIDVVAGCH